MTPMIKRLDCQNDDTCFLIQRSEFLLFYYKSLHLEPSKGSAILYSQV